MSLLETAVASSILAIAAAGIWGLGTVSTRATENQGHLAARTTEYAQDKMEQLLSLAWSDASTDTTVFPANTTGGTGLAPGGSSNPAAPVAGYLDFLDANGNLLATTGTTAPAGWYYKRVWQISSPSATMKQITVSAIVASAIGGVAQMPQSTVASLKTNPF